MRIVIQRVEHASLSIDNLQKANIGNGLLIFVGINNIDTQNDVDWLCKKIVQLRIFSDEQNKMNLSIRDIDGDILVVSQFTLYASTKKGNRPSYTSAAPPEVAVPLYESFISTLGRKFGKTIATGQFGADMQIKLTNDGPVTIVMDSTNRE